MHVVAELGEHLPLPQTPEEIAAVQPSFAGLETYCKLILSCFNQDPEQRPTFSNSVSILKPLLATLLREQMHKKQQMQQQHLTQPQAQPAAGGGTMQ